MEISEKLNLMIDPTKRKNRNFSEILDNVPKVICADGFEMSVQASEGHYCSPRDNIGPYTSVEIGYPSERVEEFMHYIDGDENADPTQTVYGWVPLETVVQIIESHGGFGHDE